MSQIYQPAILSLLLKNGGRASKTEMGIELLKNEPAKVDYY